MAVFAYHIEDRQGKREVFSLSDEASGLISEKCLYPSFRCRIDSYGKTFLYPDHILAIQEFLMRSITSKEAKYTYDEEYKMLYDLWEKFSCSSIATGLLLLGD